ncbi:hypothetical protein EAF00_007026 [Botryotinia globosa]|nr:hypothetical protein EAF00_007026 [Botryotinia globosa]
MPIRPNMALYSIFGSMAKEFDAVRKASQSCCTHVSTYRRIPYKPPSARKTWDGVPKPSKTHAVLLLHIFPIIHKQDQSLLLEPFYASLGYLHQSRAITSPARVTPFHKMISIDVYPLQHMHRYRVHGRIEQVPPNNNADPNRDTVERRKKKEKRKQHLPIPSTLYNQLKNVTNETYLEQPGQEPVTVSRATPGLPTIEFWVPEEQERPKEVRVLGESYCTTDEQNELEAGRRAALPEADLAQSGAV